MRTPRCSFLHLAMRTYGFILVWSLTQNQHNAQALRGNCRVPFLVINRTRSLQIWSSESPGLLQRPMGVSGRAATVDWKITTTLPHTLLSWLLLEIVEWHLLENPFLSLVFASHCFDRYGNGGIGITSTVISCGQRTWIKFWIGQTLTKTRLDLSNAFSRKVSYSNTTRDPFLFGRKPLHDYS